MRIISAILSIILIFTMCGCSASCKLYESVTCDVYEVASCEGYTEVTVEKDGNLYTAAVGQFDETKEKCFVVFYNNTEIAEDDEIVFLW